MFEWFEKYTEFERIPTAASFDKPMIIFFGLSIPDFILGVCSFLVVIMTWDSLLAILAAIGSGFLASYLSKLYRKKLPARFLQHFGWSIGIQKIRGVPSLFKKHKQPTFGP